MTKREKIKIEDILDRLTTYYGVSSFLLLSKKMNVSRSTISAWQIRNSISAVERTCRKLNIYHVIFSPYNDIHLLVDTSLRTLSDKENLDIYNNIKDALNKKEVCNTIASLKDMSIGEELFWCSLIGTSEHLFNLFSEIFLKNKYLDVFCAQKRLLNIIKTLKIEADSKEIKHLRLEIDKLKLLGVIDTLNDTSCAKILKNGEFVLMIIKNQREWCKS